MMVVVVMILTGYSCSFEAEEQPSRQNDGERELTDKDGTQDSGHEGLRFQSRRLLGCNSPSPRPCRWEVARFPGSPFLLHLQTDPHCLSSILLGLTQCRVPWGALLLLMPAQRHPVPLLPGLTEGLCVRFFCLREGALQQTLVAHTGHRATGAWAAGKVPEHGAIHSLAQMPNSQLGEAW